MFIHIDIDTFFASAHRIGTDIYDNIPIAVGGRSNLGIFDIAKQHRKLSRIDGAFSSSILSYNTNKSFEEYFIDKDGRTRGIITTASYEARAYGVKTAMSVAEALRVCPVLKVLPPNYPLYHELSYKLKNLLLEHIPAISQFSIDEFFCDISGYIDDDKAEQFALNLQNIITKELHIPVSMGICNAKMLSKVATNYAKPYGVRYIKHDHIDEFIEDIPIVKFPGIGRGYFRKLSQLNIKTLLDIKQHKETLYKWGKHGVWLYKATQGMDTEKLSTQTTAKKSIGLGRTFDPIQSRAEIRRRLMILCRHINFLCHNQKLYPKSYELKIMYEYGDKQKLNYKSHEPYSEKNFKQIVAELFSQIDTNISRAIIQLNITVSQLQRRQSIENLFSHNRANIDETTHDIRQKYGIDILKTGAEMIKYR